MIPKFPTFKELTISDRSRIEDLIQSYSPYSDFNFVSMWSWDTRGEMGIAELNGNLVVRFSDYVTGSPFYSFIGTNKVNETAREILELSKSELDLLVLKLVPEVTVNCLDPQMFNIEEDRDNFDYVYDINTLRTFNGNKLRSRRNFSNRFKRAYTAEVRVIDINDLSIQTGLKELCAVWADNKKFNSEEKHNEFLAIDRVSQISNSDLVSIGLFYNGSMIGFIINELVGQDFVVLHFEKADEKFVGIYAYLMQENCRLLHEMGRKKLNFEQDLGIPGLRLGKKSYDPESFLKKYTIS